jgi:hypothetical protein
VKSSISSHQILPVVNLSIILSNIMSLLDNITCIIDQFFLFFFWCCLKIGNIISSTSKSPCDTNILRVGCYRNRLILWCQRERIMVNYLHDLVVAVQIAYDDQNNSGCIVLQLSMLAQIP